MRESTISATRSTSGMTLTPRRPPGRPNRKALTYEGEIARLRLAGYSCKAIWELLVADGLQLSLSSVKREVARSAKLRRPASSQLALTPALAPRVVPCAAVSAPASVDLSLTGPELAKAWIEGQISNPLIRARIAHESSSH